MTGEPLLEIALQAGYGKRTVLDGVRFELGAGQRLGFVGSSGAGKSTLALALLGLLPWRGGWAQGTVRLRGRDLLSMPEREARRVRGREVALVPQSPMSALNGAVSLWVHFLAAWGAHETSGKSGLEARLRALLPEVRLPYDREFLNRRPGAISVGQAQRAMLAMALLHRPALLLADEPTSALDAVTQAETLKLLQAVCVLHGTALLYISHDLLSVMELCDEVAVLDGGRLVERLPVTRLGEAAHPALLGLLEALPVPASVLLAHLKSRR